MTILLILLMSAMIIMFWRQPHDHDRQISVHLRIYWSVPVSLLQ